MKKNLLFILLFSSLSLKALEVKTVQPVATELKLRKHDWKKKKLSFYPNGLPKEILFLETNNSGEETPVKRIIYSEVGKVVVEEDLIKVESSEEEETASEFKLHGKGVAYFPNGKIAKEVYFKEGMPHGPSSEYYEDGEPKTKAFYKEGKLHGPLKNYHKNGNIASEAIFENGEVLGEFNSYYEDGSHAVQKTFQEGVLEGASLEWYSNKKLKATKLFHKGLLHAGGNAPAVILYDKDEKVLETMHFKEGVQTGLHQKFHPNSTQSYQVTFHEGKKEGKEEFFAEDGSYLGGGDYVGGKPINRHIRKYSNGNFQKIACYDSKGHLIKPIEEFYESGDLQKRYLIDDEGKLFGSLFEWFEGGQIKSELYYENGLLQGLQKEFYEAGEKKIEAHYDQGKQHGQFHKWHSNGQLAIKANMQQGKRDGLYEEWYEDGHQKIEANYKQGMNHGNLKLWFPNGAITLKAYYENNLLEGPFETYYENGNLQLKQNYKSGKKVGKEELFYEDGGKKSFASFNEGALDGEKTTWFEDGQVESKGLYTLGIPSKKHVHYHSEVVDGKHPLKMESFYKDELRQGQWKEYYPNGNIKAKLDYHLGEPHGKSEVYAIDGKLIQSYSFEHGLLNGRIFRSLKDGFEEVVHFKDNIEEGPFLMYHPQKEEGKKVVAVEGQHKNGLLEGVVNEYHPTGKLVASTPYVSGKKEGEAKVYDLDGTLRLTIGYTNGEYDGVMRHYYPNGKLKKAVRYQKGLKEGEEESYSSSGELISKNQYKNNLLDGYCFKKNKDKVLVFEAEYKEGMRHGKFNKYYDDGLPKVIQTFCEDKLHGTKKVYMDNGEIKESKYEKGKKVDG